jgi:hypothetical protein
MKTKKGERNRLTGSPPCIPVPFSIDSYQDDGRTVSELLGRIDDILK